MFDRLKRNLRINQNQIFKAESKSVKHHYCHNKHKDFDEYKWKCSDRRENVISTHRVVYAKNDLEFSIWGSDHERGRTTMMAMMRMGHDDDVWQRQGLL